MDKQEIIDYLVDMEIARGSVADRCDATHWWYCFDVETLEAYLDLWTAPTGVAKLAANERVKAALRSDVVAA